MKFLIGKFNCETQAFSGYDEMDFPSIEQAKKFCRDTTDPKFVYMVVRVDKAHNDERY